MARESAHAHGDDHANGHTQGHHPEHRLDHPGPSNLSHEHDHSHGHSHQQAPGHGHGQAHQKEADHGHEHPSGLWGFIESVRHPHSHDAAEQVDTTLESSAEGIRALKISLVALLGTAIVQALVVGLSGSVGLLADTIHNFADALTSVPLWAAFVLGRRAASRRYTYGYGRAEDLAGIAIVAIIFCSALLAAWESFQKLLHPEPLSNIGLVAAAAILGFLGNEAAALYRIRVGKKIGSAALVADGYHARTDGLTSLAVLLGVLGAALGSPLADPLVGFAITVAILLVTRDAALAVWHRVMDAVDPSVIDQIEHTAAAVEGVEQVRAVRARWHGHRIHAELQIVVDEDLPTWRSHAIAERVRRDLFHGAAKLGSIAVHVDPCEHGGVDRHRATAHHELPIFVEG